MKRITVLTSILLAAGMMFHAFTPHAVSSTHEAEPIMPLSEVKAGMQGEWRTVVSGTEIKTFPLEVIGIAENFVGPQRAVVICKALDPENVLSGPVAGMSGSPVYINGKLVGAYAYGFTFPKEQAIIGVTPIADMLEVWEKTPDKRSRKVANPFEQSLETASGSSSSQPYWRASETSARSEVPSLNELQNLIKPLPTPLMVSGVSPKVLDAFKPWFDKAGLQPMVAPGGRTSRPMDTELKPGSAVAGVLMSGDFNFVGTGTVTYRQGNKILGFGHPFFQVGELEMPMAAAEIITVVRNYLTSFKLANCGPIIGTIYQDRLTAIAGEIGRTAHLAPVNIRVKDDFGVERSYRGDLFNHQYFGPLISAVALMESLTSTMESGEQQTLHMRTRLQMEGHEPVEFVNVASGESPARKLAFDFLSIMMEIANNPFEKPVISAIDFDVNIQNLWDINTLEAASITRNKVKPGDTIELQIQTRNFRGDIQKHAIAIPLPEEVRSEDVAIFVGDAGAATAIDAKNFVVPVSMQQILEKAGSQRSRNGIFVKLIRRSPGQIVEGQNMRNLPPSVLSTLNNPGSFSTTVQPLNNVTLWETTIPLTGEFSGQKSLSLRIE